MTTWIPVSSKSCNNNIKLDDTEYKNLVAINIKLTPWLQLLCKCIEKQNSLLNSANIGYEISSATLKRDHLAPRHSRKNVKLQHRAYSTISIQWHTRTSNLKGQNWFKTLQNRLKNQHLNCWAANSHYKLCASYYISHSLCFWQVQDKPIACKI